MVKNVRQAFIDILAEVTWMDEVTRQKAILKAQNIIAHVGYPNDLYENDAVAEYYAHLKMEPDTFFNNSLRWNLLYNNHQFNSLRQPVNRSGWEELLTLDPTVANAFYDPSRNTMRMSI